MNIEENKVVSIEYEVKTADDNQQIDSNKNGAPLKFIYGKGQVIAGLEKNILNAKKGDTKDFTVEPGEGYGEYNPDALQDVPREQFEGIELHEGMTLYGQAEDGNTVQVTVREFDDAKVKIDHNHPLAGKKLAFSVTVLGVRDATSEEIGTGMVQEPSEGCGCGTGCGCH